MEKLCHCGLMRKNRKEAKENKQMKLFHLKSTVCKCNVTRKSLKNYCSCKKNQTRYCCEFIKMLNSLKRKNKNT